MDLAIRNATIIDGTGAKGFKGDVGIKDGKIVAVGIVEGRAKEEIDAKGAVVSPGFIDCHTHYDAQVTWDDMLSPSVYHGVTTVLAGNCGFTLAPLSGRKEDVDYLLAMLSRVEGMPLTSLQAAVKPTWKTFGEYLDTIDGKMAINTGFMVGHSALRRYVMGERAVGHQASSEEIKAMADLLRKSLSEGGTGFSTTISVSHHDHNGDPVPSRAATDEEILTLSAVLRDFPGTWLELLPATGGYFGDRQYKLSTEMSLAAQRPLNWNLFLVDATNKKYMETQAEMGTYAAKRGAKVYALVPAVPLKTVVNLRTGVQFDMLEDWNDFLHLPEKEKIAAMRDKKILQRLEEGMKRTTVFHGLPKDFGDFLIVDLRTTKNAKWKGRHLKEYAADSGVSNFEALFKLAAEEDLWLSLATPELGGDEESWSIRGDIWRNEYNVVGGSDAGAHLDAINTFALSTQLLGEGIRKRKLLPLEEGVRLLTSAIADKFGLKGRGRLEPGAVADVVVFDPDTIDCGPMFMRNDLPEGESRLYAESIGVHHVICNGVPVAADNKPTGRKGGKVLRGGKDTVTVPLTSPVKNAAE